MWFDKFKVNIFFSKQLQLGNTLLSINKNRLKFQRNEQNVSAQDKQQNYLIKD